MIDITKIEEVSSKLIFNENHKELIVMETFLKGELDSAEDIMESEHVLFLYLVVKIKETSAISIKKHQKKGFYKKITFLSKETIIFLELCLFLGLFPILDIVILKEVKYTS